ncbi:MAG: UDP-N-acetylglucosamine acyltransferase [Chlamydiae bacterium SM23_39]|nr:MAG: UDP-N-acetylglucosamine acyltransferase [Chlamydiae bacterium SM23_39]
MDINKYAFVEEGVYLGKGVSIEPFAVVKKGAVLKDNVVIKSHAYVNGNVNIGENSTIWPGAVIGTKPQDLKYQGEKTYVKIGKNCDIREFATINASCQESSVVEIGDDCLIMAYCHVAHNCKLGKRVVMANSSMLAGHVEIEDFAIIGGMTPVHQFVRVGAYAMVGGFSRVVYDIPPYSIGGGDPFKFGGINIIGLQRNGFPLSIRNKLCQIFKITFRKNLTLEKALEKIEKEIEPIPEVKHWVDFCRNSKRGIMGINGKK